MIHAQLTKLLLALTFMPITIMAQIPVVHLNGNFGDDYSKGDITITDTEGNTVAYNVKSKWRGHSSKAYDKKSFAVKLLDENGDDKDASILGMREDNNWILDAMAVDKARMRNRVSFDLWNDFASDTYIKKDYEPESFNGTHGKFVELYLNDSYHGIYCLTEKLDRKQLKLKKYKNGVRGVLYKADTWEGTNFYEYKSSYDNTQPTWMGWASDYPDVEDEGETDYEPIYNAISFVVDSPDNEFETSVASLFDLPVWNDYFIFIKTILAYDNAGKNTFAYLYDKNEDNRLGIAPWDLDATWGRNYDASETNASDIYEGHRLLERLNDTKGYQEAMAKRYFELRENVFSADSLKKRFRNYMSLLGDCGALQRETERWNGINEIELDFEKELAYIETWIDKRLDVLDNYYGKFTTDISNAEVSVEEKLPNNSGRIYTLTGQAVDKSYLKTGGLYIRNGKKFIYRQ